MVKNLSGVLFLKIQILIRKKTVNKLNHLYRSKALNKGEINKLIYSSIKF